MKPALKKLIAQGKTKEVLTELLILTEQNDRRHLHDEVVMLSAQYEEFNKKKRLQMTTNAEDTVAGAKMNNAILSIIERIDQPKRDDTTEVNGLIPPGSENPVPKIFESENTGKNPTWKYLSMAAVVIGLLAGLAEILDFINIFPAKSNANSQLTIYVHGLGGKQDYVLENAGELLVDLDGDRRFAKIGEKGRTVFNEIPAKFTGQELPISVNAEGYEAVKPNKQYEFGGKAIYFAIQKEKGLGQIKGIVKSEDGNDFISNVLVMVENVHTTETDELGRFDMQIPVTQIQDKYSISLLKDGFHSLTEFYYPNSSAEFRLIKKNSE